jgi:hypothetical protein
LPKILALPSLWIFKSEDELAGWTPRWPRPVLRLVEDLIAACHAVAAKLERLAPLTCAARATHPAPNIAVMSVPAGGASSHAVRAGILVAVC